MNLLIRWGALAASFWVATALIPGIDVLGGFTTYLWVALLFGLINSILGGLVKLLTLPAVILTFGLFFLNSLTIKFTSFRTVAESPPLFRPAQMT